MKLPSEYAKDLEADPEMTLKEAVELAEELGCQYTHYEVDDGKEYADLDADFIINTIGIREGCCFLFITKDGSEEKHKVVRGNMFNTGFATCTWSDYPGSMEYERSKNGDWDEYATNYGELWLAWLQGRVIPVTREEKFIRQDTEEIVA